MSTKDFDSEESYAKEVDARRVYSKQWAPRPSIAYLDIIHSGPVYASAYSVLNY